MLMLILYYILNLTSGYFALLLHLLFPLFVLVLSFFLTVDQFSLCACVRTYVYVCVCIFVCRVSYRIASRLEPVANTPLNIMLRWDENGELDTLTHSV